MTARDIRSPRLWLGLVAGTALAFGGATAFAGEMGSSSMTHSSPTTNSMTPDTAATTPAPAGSHTSLKELQTAQVHTGYAADATDLKDAKTHLRHAANCLVGRKSPDFKSSANDPCGQEGAGAIPDSTDPQRVALAKDALSQINDGLQSDKLSGAQKAAKEATKTLRLAVTGTTEDKE